LKIGTLSLALLAAIATSPAMAQDASLLNSQRIGETQGIVGLSFVVALVLISTITSLLHLTGRRQWTQREAALVSENAQLRSALDRADVFLSAEAQIIVAWGSASGEPDIEGDLSLVTEAPVPRRVLGFGSWLAPEAAQEFEGYVERLRKRGEGFRLSLTSIAGRHLEAEGRAVGGRAVLRIRDVSGDRLELARLRERHAHTLLELGSLKTLLDVSPQAIWMRDGDEKLIWVNAAYAKAVEATDPADAVRRGIELLDRAARDASRDARQTQLLFQKREPAVVAGGRHLLEVIELPATIGAVGQATDLSELEQVRADLVRQMEAHTRTLDQLSTAVAIFDRGRRLVFHNSAYRQLWSLDPAFLSQRPTDSEILDRLRADHRLPEQADFRSWKAAFLSTYQSVETVEQVWHLPDTRTLRTVVNPNPQGGVTYLFDDMSERFHLESRYNSLFHVQTETLNTLTEGVAVFGSDGRLKLFNPALENIWNVPARDLENQPHIDHVVKLFSPLASNSATWDELRAIVSGLHDARTGFERRFVREDGKIVQCAVAPLPDGAVLMTFSDVTAGANVERALTERNKALVDAEKLRNDFVHHVSYELRSPLTNIIGFIHLLTEGAVGSLNEKQREYTGYILQSSAALLAIINDILDLATIDAGAMELTLGEVDIRATIDAAAQGVQDRLAESSIHLRIVATDNIGSFQADGKRIRQILFNLLSNAIGFSSPGQTVTLAAMRRDDRIVFKITDEGRGIPADLVDRVFERFQSSTSGSRHRGVGLGLSIVRAFIDLHGGEAQIQSAPGEGTTVTCILPATQQVRQRDAEVA
jgi:signal transduction histidine kinase